MDYKIYEVDKQGETWRALRQFNEDIVALSKEFRASAQRHDKATSVQDMLNERLKSWDPDVVSLTGQDYPVTQVRPPHKDGCPRAYEKTPDVYLLQRPAQEHEKQKGWVLQPYMYVPVGYDGDHFVPRDARLVEDEEEQKFIELGLFHGGWDTPLALYNQRPKGVALPDDYVDVPLTDQLDFGTERLFIAQGRSLALLKDYNERQEEHRQATNVVCEYLKTMLNDNPADMMTDKIEKGEGYYFNWTIRQSGPENENTVFYASLRKEGRLDMMQAGQPVKMKDTIAYSVKASGLSSYEYEIVPRYDTAAGLELSALMDDVPDYPQLSDYEELLIPTSKAFSGKAVALSSDGLFRSDDRTPRVQQFQGQRVLAYEADRLTDENFSPPDSIEISPALCHWVREDEFDIELGIRPPPVPEELLDEMKAYQRALEENDAGNTLNGPAPDVPEP